MTMMAACWVDVSVSSHISSLQRKLILLIDGFFDVGNLEHLFQKDKEVPVAEKVLTARKSIGRKLRLAQY